MEVITIKYDRATVTRSRSAPNGHDLFGNKHVAHHFDRKFDGESNGDLENHQKVTKIQKISKKENKIQEMLTFEPLNIFIFCFRLLTQQDKKS